MRATAHILEDVGFDRASTNRIAKRAGVSIGSLYQYFPNKTAIVAALIQRHADRQLEVLREQVAKIRGVDLAEGVRSLVTAVLAAHRVEPELERILLENVPQTGKLAVFRAWNVQATGIVEAALRARQDQIRPERLDLAVLILIHATQGVIHGVVLEQPDLLSDEDVAEELSALILGYLRPTTPEEVQR